MLIKCLNTFDVIDRPCVKKIEQYTYRGCPQQKCPPVRPEFILAAPALVQLLFRGTVVLVPGLLGLSPSLVTPVSIVHLLYTTMRAPKC